MGVIAVLIRMGLQTTFFLYLSYFWKDFWKTLIKLTKLAALDYQSVMFLKLANPLSRHMTMPYTACKTV